MRNRNDEDSKEKKEKKTQRQNHRWRRCHLKRNGNKMILVVAAQIETFSPLRLTQRREDDKLFAFVLSTKLFTVLFQFLRQFLCFFFLLKLAVFSLFCHCNMRIAFCHILFTIYKIRLVFFSSSLLIFLRSSPTFETLFVRQLLKTFHSSPLFAHLFPAAVSHQIYRHRTENGNTEIRRENKE